MDKISSSYSAAGILTVEAPRVLTAPEGASVQVRKDGCCSVDEAMLFSSSRQASRHVILYTDNFRRRWPPSPRPTPLTTEGPRSRRTLRHPRRFITACLFDGNLEFGYKSMRSRSTGSSILKVLTVLQVIAATTESPDGRTKSTMSYTSSNSSSSSTMTSSSGALGTMPSMPGRRGGQALL